MIFNDNEKINYTNAFLERRHKRAAWIFWVVSLVGLVAMAAFWAVRTRAEEALGHGWREHHLGESAAPVEPATEGGFSTPFSSDPTVWRPCPWDGEEVSSETESGEESEVETALDSTERTTSEEGREGESREANPREEMIYHSRPNDRMEIALSFDDGPHPRLTPLILSILEEYGIKATFFMVGENVGYYPAAARAVAEAGHEIGNHTFSHRKFDKLGEEELRCEIFSCEEAIGRVSNTPVRFIRPPEGQMSDSMRKVIGELDYRVILWDVDTRDWAHTSPESISRHILETVQAGDIILMHDFIGYNSPTPAALRLVIPALLERGFHFVTVGELVEGD